MRVPHFLMMSMVGVMLATGCATVETKPSHIVSKQKEMIIIAQSSFYEACDKLTPGQEVEFSFETNAPVDFDVHYHSPDGKVYPVKNDNITTLKGGFVADAKGIYCCMWNNKNWGPVDLNYEFKIVERKE